MAKELYVITDYDLLDMRIQIYQPVLVNQVIEIKKLSSGRIEKALVVIGDDVVDLVKQYPRDSISETKKGIYNESEFLPYKATVTEDLPSSIKFKPRVYHNCKLMREKHGGYLQFYHERSKQILRIAMNSHTYKPTN